MSDETATVARKDVQEPMRPYCSVLTPHHVDPVALEARVKALEDEVNDLTTRLNWLEVAVNDLRNQNA